MNIDKDQKEKDSVPNPQNLEDKKLKEPSENAGSEAGKKDEPVLKTDSEEKSSAVPKVLGILSLGVAGLAIFLSMSVMRKVDNNMGQIKSSIQSIENNTSSFKSEVTGKLGRVNFEIDTLKSKVEKSQRKAAILELKRALVTVQEVSSSEKTPEMQAKSDQLISNIESYLEDLGETKMRAGTIEVREAPNNTVE